MILTVTPNPSVDRTVDLASPLVAGGVLRASRSFDQSGGKGVNISRAALAAGVPTIAVLPAAEDDPFVLDLLAHGVDVRPEPSDHPVRVNLTLTDPDGTTTKINDPGPELDTRTLRRLADATAARAGRAEWVVLAGSLPSGAPVDWYAELAGRLGDLGARVAVDTSGGPLAEVARSLGGGGVALLKPNAEELAEISGDDPAKLESDAAATAAAGARLVQAGAGAVLATLGRHGAVLVTAAGAWLATPPPTRVVSTVGAGDSSLFGYLLGDLRGAEPAERLRLAVAYGAAAAGLPGTTIPRPDQAHPELVQVTLLDAAPSPQEHA